MPLILIQCPLGNMASSLSELFNQNCLIRRMLSAVREKKKTVSVSPDKPLARWAQSSAVIHVRVRRGPLENVLGRLVDSASGSSSGFVAPVVDLQGPLESDRSVLKGRRNSSDRATNLPPPSPSFFVLLVRLDSGPKSSPRSEYRRPSPFL